MTLLSHKQFVADAQRFYARYKKAFIFRALQWFTRATDEQLEYLICQIYCTAISENTYLKTESLLRTHLGFLALPFYYLITKKVFCKREQEVDVNFEVSDAAYLARYFEKTLAGIRGACRITPTLGRISYKQYPSTESIIATVAPDVLIKLFIFCPFIYPFLLFFPRGRSFRLWQAYRGALSMYALYDGYFRRYPCRHFVTYADETNRGGRYLAFKQNCKGKLFLVMIGERNYHASLAFGRMDVYFLFGPFYKELFTELAVDCPLYYPIGSPYVDAYFNEIGYRGNNGYYLQNGQIKDFDIMFVGQVFWRLDDVDENMCVGIQKIIQNLNEYKRRRPHISVVYLWRPEPNKSRQRVILQMLKELFSEPLTIVDNKGNGQCYKEVARADLIVTFQSTLGHEVFAQGAKVLFVNYSKNPAETVCPDERFQITDDAASYERFEAKVDELLKMKLESPPAFALARNVTDGRFQEKIAAVINGDYIKDGEGYKNVDIGKESSLRLAQSRQA